jgi:hypothetical protein
LTDSYGSRLSYCGDLKTRNNHRLESLGTPCYRVWMGNVQERCSWTRKGSDKGPLRSLSSGEFAVKGMDIGSPTFSGEERVRTPKHRYKKQSTKPMTDGVLRLQKVLPSTRQD